MKHDEKILLETETRTIVGKKVKKLRREGKIPANLYGEDMKSTAITLPEHEFVKAYRTAGDTTVMYSKLEKEEIPVLVHRIQKHPITGSILHVDFRKVNLKKKIEAHVPIKIIGESEAVNKKGGVLLTLSESLLVSALPDELPHEIEIDISTLHELNDEISVASLAKGDKYEIVDPEDKVIVRITEHKEEEVAPQLEVALPEGEEAPEGGEGTTESTSEDSQDDSEKAAPEGGE